MEKFLGDSQKRILSLLDMYGCLRSDQLEAMIEAEFAKQNFEQSIKRLIYYGLICHENGLVSLYGGSNRMNPLLIQAVDVMLLFDMKKVELHKPAQEPLILTFFKTKGDKLHRYDVCYCPVMCEQIISAQLESLNGKYRTIIVMLDELSQQKEISINCEHCFAIMDKGSYKFYAPTGV